MIIFYLFTLLIPIYLSETSIKPILRPQSIVLSKRWSIQLNLESGNHNFFNWRDNLSEIDFSEVEVSYFYLWY